MLLASIALFASPVAVLVEEGEKIPEGMSDLLQHVHPDMLFEPAAVPDEENAYFVWKELPRDLKNRFPSDLLYDPLTGAPLDDASPPSGALAERLGPVLAEKEDLFRAVEAGVSRGRFRYPRETLGNAEERERAEALHSQLFDIARWRILRIKMAASRGTFDVVERDIAVLLQTAAILASAEDGVLLHGKATHLDSLTGPLIRWLARYEDMPVDLLERLLARLDGPPDRTSLARALRAEFRNHILPRIASVPEGADAARLAGAAKDLESGEEPNVLVRSITAVLEGHPKPFDREATVRLVSELMAELARSLDLPWRDRARKVAAGAYREADVWPDELTLTRSRFPPPKPSALTQEDLQRTREALRKMENPFGKFMIRKLHGLLGNSEVGVASEARLTEAAHEGTRAVVALCIHARRNGGALPASLEDLVTAKILPSVPRDPFTGEPLRYSREQAVIWSAGPDGKDDGGLTTDDVWSLATVPREPQDR
jgi:hypothetical protein